MEATQAPAQPISTEGVTPRQLVISVEFVAYLALLILALVFRFAELDTVSLTTTEVREALSAWRVVFPGASGGELVPESPLLFLLHSVAFTTLGGSEFSARLFTALAGAGLVLSPLLFRELLGRTRAFVFSLMLVFSPTLLAASRFDVPVIWSLLFVVLMLWSLWRYAWLRRSLYAILATVLLVGIVLLTEPAGFILAVILIGAGLYTLYQSPVEAVESATGQNEQMNLLTDFPWRTGLVLAVGIMLLVATGFLLYPAGLSSVSGLLSAALEGFVTPSAIGAPLAFPLSTSLFYEPLMWVFGLVAIVRIAQQGTATWVERFLIGWLILGAAASLLYLGAGPQHALWTIIPLTGLVTSLAAEFLTQDEHPFWNAPWWGKWLLAIGTMALLAMMAVHLQGIARGMLTAPDETVGQMLQVLVRTANNNLMFLLSIVLTIGLYFTAASAWGNVAAARGSALGVLLFGMVTALSSGWQVAVSSADSPIELWHVQPTNRETALLRQTLIEVAKRETDGVFDLPIYIQAPDDGVIAWLVRDFVNATFINDVSQASTQPVVILPDVSEPPDLGDSYVGQRFVIRTWWSPQFMVWFDYPAWWFQRRTRTGAIPYETVVLWLRQDVYDGIPDDVG